MLKISVACGCGVGGVLVSLLCFAFRRVVRCRVVVRTPLACRVRVVITRVRVIVLIGIYVLITAVISAPAVPAFEVETHRLARAFALGIVRDTKSRFVVLRKLNVVVRSSVHRWACRSLVAYGVLRTSS